MRNSEKIHVTIFRAALQQGGADRVALKLLAQLPRERYQLTLLVMRRDDQVSYDLPADIQFISLDVSHLRYATNALRRYFREARVDLFCSLDSGGNVPATIAHRLSRSKAKLVISERNVLWVNGVTAWRAVQVAGKLMSYRLADRLVCVSRQQQASVSRQLGLPSDFATTIYNPVVDDSLFSLAEADPAHRWFAERIPVIVAAGRLVKQKDYPTLLRAMAAAGRPCRLIVLGDGPLRDELQALAADLGLAERVDFVGFRHNPIAFMRRASVYVLSSLHEGLPGALIQAMAAGAPCVATDCPTGPAEIIEHGKTGLLVPVADVAALSAAIDSCLADPAAARSRAEAAAAPTMQRFSTAAAVAHYDRLFCSLLSV